MVKKKDKNDKAAWLQRKSCPKFDIFSNFPADLKNVREKMRITAKKKKEYADHSKNRHNKKKLQKKHAPPPFMS